MNIQNILVPIDFSNYSDAALELATSLARDSRAELHILHVKEPFHIYDIDNRYGDIFPYADLDTLQNALEKVRPSDHSLTYHHWLLTGEAVNGILELAREQNIELIVMGTHGRTGLLRVLMGSVAEGVLRRAACPVLTVKEPSGVVADDEAAVGAIE